MKKQSDIFKLRRYFAIAGLTCTMIATILIVLFYRQMAINDILDLGERNNLVLAKTFLNPIKKELIDYLVAVKDVDGTEEDIYELPVKIEQAIQDAMSDTLVIRTKIYNQKGIVVFSTKPTQIGLNYKDHKQFITAIDGSVASKIIYNDAFSFFQKPSPEDNLIQSYVPVRLNVTSPVFGVFEIYTDVQSVAHRIERTEFMAFATVTAILLLLFIMLSIIVNRATSTISKQQSIIQERTKTLELLSAKMLYSQETEKKNISETLHEEITQTLSSVKHNIETLSCDLNKKYPDVIQLPLKQAVKVLQHVIQEVRTLAVEMHPPSLNDFGLTKTIKMLCNDYLKVYPDYTIESSLDVNEAGMPASLKILIYRIIQEALGSIIRNGEADLIRLSLIRDEATITLTIEDNAVALYSSRMLPDEETTQTAPLAGIKERTLLSGGTFSIGRTSNGGTLATASWTYSERTSD